MTVMSVPYTQEKVRGEGTLRHIRRAPQLYRPGHETAIIPEDRRQYLKRFDAK
jgi:hypothetical protein